MYIHNKIAYTLFFVKHQYSKNMHTTVQLNFNLTLTYSYHTRIFFIGFRVLLASCSYVISHMIKMTHPCIRITCAILVNGGPCHKYKQEPKYPTCHHLIQQFCTRHTHFHKWTT